MTELLRFENISYHLGANNRRVAVTSALDEGAVLLVKGPSGSGKTTLLRILARLQECDEGRVYFKDALWFSIPPRMWRSKVHYVAQKPAIFNGTVQDNLNKPFELKNKRDETFQPDQVQSAMEQLLLSREMLGQDARTLSGGEAARVALLRSVIIHPNVLLLDEPTAALDEKSRFAVLHFLNQWLKQEPQRGIILVSHGDDGKEFTRVNSLEIEVSPDEVD